MNLIGKIDNFHHNSGFNFIKKERLVDYNRNIYFMHLSKSSGVQIIKWYTTQLMLRPKVYRTKSKQYLFFDNKIE